VTVDEMTCQAAGGGFWFVLVVATNNDSYFRIEYEMGGEALLLLDVWWS
jgi:hypothetical protein